MVDLGGMLPVRSLMSLTSVIGIRLGTSGWAELEASHSTWQLARRWVPRLPELVCDAPIMQGPFKFPLPGVRAGACSQQGAGSGPARALPGHQSTQLEGRNWAPPFQPVGRPSKTSADGKESRHR